MPEAGSAMVGSKWRMMRAALPTERFWVLEKEVRNREAAWIS